ncbi:MAG: hypothetical protein IJ584_15345, partial [Bacteroidales bacterium]|nr:hypothetical protein [Bacteroidales bacterium]
IDEMIKRNSDAILILDFHTYGGGCVPGIRQMNELVIPADTGRNDKYYGGIFDVAWKYNERITSLFVSKYNSTRGIFNKKNSVGAITECDFYRKDGRLCNYAVQKNFLSLTFEGFNGFPGDDVPFTEETAQANAEMLGNFIYSFCEHYSRYEK